MPTKTIIDLVVNGDARELAIQPYDSLNTALRTVLGLTGTKRGCDTGGCGACTVLVDDRAIYSCMYPARRAVGKRVVTIEGLGRPGSPHSMQEAFIHSGGIQCGYCSPGMILAAVAIVTENPSATEDDVREGLAGNLCRCTGYVKIVEAVLEETSEWKATA
jgi:carbon-monoxide dehydrogenase small subunit